MSEVHRIPRAVLTAGEVAALLQCSMSSVERWSATGQLQAVDAPWLKDARFDRHVVDAQLASRLGESAGEHGRRQLVRLAYGELTCRGGQLVETGVAGPAGANLLDEEILSVVAKAIEELAPADCNRPMFDTWARNEHAPSSEEVMRRLSVFTWPRVLSRASGHAHRSVEVVR